MKTAEPSIPPGWTLLAVDPGALALQNAGGDVLAFSRGADGTTMIEIVTKDRRRILLPSAAAAYVAAWMNVPFTGGPVTSFRPAGELGARPVEDASRKGAP